MPGVHGAGWAVCQVSTGLGGLYARCPWAGWLRARIWQHLLLYCANCIVNHAAISTSGETAVMILGTSVQMICLGKYTLFESEYKVNVF